MKYYLLSLFTLTILLTTSCKKDDCVAGSLETVIVGEWNVTVLGLPAGSVEFEANGNLIDPDGALLDEEINGVALDDKSYEVNSNTSLTLRAENNSDFVEYDVDVTSYDCDEIVFDLLGFEGKLNRK